MPGLPGPWNPRGNRVPAHRVAVGIVCPAPTLCVLEADGAAPSPLEAPEMLSGTSLVYLDGMRKGWAIPGFISVKPKPQISA